RVLAAWEYADDVLRIDPARAPGNARVHRHSRRDRLEVASRSGCEQLVEAETARFQKSARRRDAEPSFHAQCCRLVRAVCKCVLCLAERRLHNVPWIPGGVIRVDDERTRGPLPACFLELVRPAAVPGECASLEELRLRRRSGRIASQDEHDLSPDVVPGVVVPVVLGRAYTVTDEYEIRIQRHQRVRCTWPCDYVLAPGDVDRVIPGRERDAASCRVRMPRVDGDALSKSASRRLEADEGELRRDVARCQPATGGARCAPLQQIVGEKREVPADAGRGNRASRGRRERLRRILCAAGERQREQEAGRQRDANHGYQLPVIMRACCWYAGRIAE